MSAPVLEVHKLVKDYGPYRAVDTISFDIQKGQVMGLLGPNGAGKSTTIQILVGLTEATDGQITYFGKDFRKHRQVCLGRINFASAYNTLQYRLTVRENLLVFAGLYGVQKPMQKIAELLEYFEIGRLGNHKYRDLSAGEKTRVNLAKALLNDPELVLMDEPTASLDPDIADKTLQLIEALRRDRSLSILFTSHNMAEVTRICDEVIFLDRGKIVSQDTPANHIKRLNRASVVLHYRGSHQKLAGLLARKQLMSEQLEPNIVRIQTTNDAVAAVIASIVSADITVKDIAIEKATLEDVFLEIARRQT